MAKVMMLVTKDELISNMGTDNLSTGIPAGVHSAIHTLIDRIDAHSDHVVALIDADNAFNSISNPLATPKLHG